jgi:YD repeat-containing protein
VYTIDVSDAAGNLVDVYEPAVTVGTGTVPVIPHTHYDYNASGNEIDQIDANAEASSNPASGETEWTYDQNGNELSRTLPDNSGSTPEVEHYTYNIYNQVATHVDFDGNTAAYTYYSDFAAGDYTGSLEQVQYTAPAGSGKASEKVGYTYDSLGRQATVSNSTEDTSSDPATGITTNSYDSQGNLIEQDTAEGSITYGFNQAAGQLSNASTGFTFTSYLYNTQGQLTSVSVQTRTTLTGTWSSPATSTYTYDGDGNKATETLPNQDKTTYVYDDLNRLIRQSTGNASGGTLFIETLVLNPNGTRASATETQVQLDHSTTTLNYAWGYDADDRLNSESLTATSSSNADSMAVGLMDYSDAYTFDLNGNQLTDTKTGTADGPAGVTTDVYNGDDQLMNTSAGGVINTVYTYDPNGSQTSVNAGGTITTYTFDVQNKMVGYQSGTNTASYIYNDDGNRVQETANGTVTFYLTDTQNPTGYAQPIEQRSSQTAVPSMTYMLGDRAFGQINGSSSTTSYLLTDGHGSTIALAGLGGTVTATYAYTAYGDSLTPLGAVPATVFLFGGDAVYDAVSGLYLHGDGTRGVVGPRFIEADTEGNGSTSDPISLHKYLYANANPISGADPSGHDDLVELLTDIGIDGVLGAIASPVIKSAGSYLAQALLPNSLVNNILNAPTADAITGGVSGTGNLPIGSLPVGFSAGGGLEALWSPKTHNAALYGFAGGGINFGTTNPSAGISGAVGLVFGTPTSEDYTKHFITISVPFASIQQALQKKIDTQLISVATQSITILAQGGSGDVALYHYEATSLSSVTQTVASDLANPSSLTANFFFDPTGGGSFGVSLSRGLLSTPNSSSNVSINYSYYWQLLPKNSVSFR